MTVEELIKVLDGVKDKSSNVFFWEEVCRREVTEVSDEEDKEVFILSR